MKTLHVLRGDRYAKSYLVYSFLCSRLQLHENRHNKFSRFAQMRRFRIGGAHTYYRKTYVRRNMNRRLPTIRRPPCAFSGDHLQIASGGREVDSVGEISQGGKWAHRWGDSPARASARRTGKVWRSKDRKRWWSRWRLNWEYVQKGVSVAFCLWFLPLVFFFFLRMCPSDQRQRHCNPIDYSK